MHSGCIWGLSQLSNLYQRREGRKMLAKRMDGDGEHGTEIPIPSKEEENHYLDNGADLPVEIKANDKMNRGSGKAWMLNFIGKKLSKRKKHKGKTLPSSSQMMRTISIHHLECNDFVVPDKVDQKASSSGASRSAPGFHDTDLLAISEHESSVFKIVHGSTDGKPGEACGAAKNAPGFHDTDLFAISEHESSVFKIVHGSTDGKPGEVCGVIDAVEDCHKSQIKLDKGGNHLLDVHIALKERLIESRDALMKQKNTIPKGMTSEYLLQSKLFMDALELFNANREALLGSSKDPSSMSPDYVKVIQAPIEARVLTKSASFAGLNFSGSASGISLPSQELMESDSFVTHLPKSQSVNSSVKIVGVGPNSEDLPSTHELRKRREAGSVLNSLSVLRQKIKDVIMENRKVHRISRDRILHKVPIGHKLPRDGDEKLDLQDGPVSERCDLGGDGNKLYSVPAGSYYKFGHKSIRRSHSLTESLDMYSQLLNSISVDEQRKAPEGLKSVREDSDLLQRKVPKNMGRMLSSPEFRSYSFSKDVQSEVNHAFQSFQTSEMPTAEPLVSEMETAIDKTHLHSTTSPIVEVTRKQAAVLEPDTLFSAREALVSDIHAMPTVENITEIIGTQVNPTSAELIGSYQFSEASEDDLLNEPKTQTDTETDNVPGKPSIISSLVLDIREDPASSEKCLVPKDCSVPQLLHIESEDQLPDVQSNIECTETNIAEHFKSDYNHEQMTGDTGDTSSILVHVDYKHETVFNFVKYILSKSGYGTLHGETDVFHELGTAASGALCDKSFEQGLLLDLITEVLLEVHENSTAPNPWLFHFHPKIRSMSAGYYLLKDVWAEISWHLCSPQGLHVTLGDLMAYDFAKSNGWMNLYRDAECAGLQMAHLILDDLFDEIVVGFDGF